MSLLNEMLQDLDKKTSNRSVILPIASINQHWIKVIPNTLFWLIVSATLFVLTVVIVYFPRHTELVISPPTQRVVRPTPITALVPKIEPVPEVVLVSSISPIPTTPQVLESTLLPAPIFGVKAPEELPPVDLSAEMSKPLKSAWYDEKLNNALEAIEDGNDPRAIDLLELILTRYAHSIDAREYLAGLYLAHSDMTQAYDVLDEGMRLEPHNLRLSIMKARLMVEQDQHSEALKLLEQFNPRIDKDPEYYALLAAIFETLGHSNEAGSVYQALIRQDPTEGQYWLGFAVSLEHKNATRQAIEAYKRASSCENIQPAVRSYAEQRLKVLQG